MDAPLHRNWLRKFGLVAMLPGLCALSLLMPVQAQSGARSVKKPVAAAKVVQTGAEAGAKSNSRSAVDRPIKDKWAVVVGISEFADKKINLRYPAKDATDFYNFLVSDGGFKKDHVRLLVNEKATRSNILSTIGDRWLPRLAHPDDLVVVYISSHGSPADLDVGGVNYVVAHDTDTESLYATGLPLQDLMRIIKARVHCDRVVMILDACHSGAASA
ncbi:MAG TPA: caspase family protein, partial [Candidatus Obscuribacter sp.]|nr:caspase family protein [Candidatus Obscuribacter sp.]